MVPARGWRRFAWAALGAALGVGAARPSPAGAQDAAPAPAAPAPAAAADARLVHLVLVGDTADPDVGESVGGDLRAVRLALEDGLPAARRSLTVLDGEAATSARVLEIVRSLPVTADDAVVVYYAGHGAWADAGPYLRPRGQVLPRADLLAAMRANGPRLAVLLTDCCGTYVGQTFLYRERVPDPALFRDLFCRARGTVDVTAASRGQVAVGDRAQGGYFTQALVSLLEGTPAETLDADHDGVVSWREAVTHLTAATAQVFSRTHPRGLAVKGTTLRGQTPFVFGDLATPGPRVPPSPRRLGTRTEDAGGARGARVVAVEPGTPAAWAGLAPGDVVVAVRVPGGGPADDRRPVPTAAALRDVLASLPGSRVVVLETRDGRATTPDAPPRETWVRLGP